MTVSYSRSTFERAFTDLLHFGSLCVMTASDGRGTDIFKSLRLRRECDSDTRCETGKNSDLHSGCFV